MSNSSEAISLPLAMHNPFCTSEIWDEARRLDFKEVVGALIRRDLSQEKIHRLDLSYVGVAVTGWWRKQPPNADGSLISSELKVLLLESIHPDHLSRIRAFGCPSTRVSALLLEHLFSIPDRVLALMVHESVCEISGIIDVKYPYEDHKELFPKNSGSHRSDWGKGLGIIRPHNDDLYESGPVNVMCLTVCNDTSKTPTLVWRVSDLVDCLSDYELGSLALEEARFRSGTNVEGRIIESNRTVLRLDPDDGIGLRLDFRVDENFGPRMLVQSEDASKAIAKIKGTLPDLKPIATNPSSGSLSLLANYKVLHGRSALKFEMLTQGESSRILFRSKGYKSGFAL